MFMQVIKGTPTTLLKKDTYNMKKIKTKVNDNNSTNKSEKGTVIQDRESSTCQSF